MNIFIVHCDHRKYIYVSFMKFGRCTYSVIQ